MHWKDLRSIGETEQRLYGLDAWEESPYYTDRERAAFAWTEAVSGEYEPVEFQRRPSMKMETTANQVGYPRGFHRLEPRQSARFVELLEPNLGPLKRYVAAVLKYGPDVDDIVQQTALKAYVHMDQFRFEAQFGSWLRSIALNEIRQLQRQRTGLRIVEGLDLVVADGRESAQTLWERKETAQAVHRAIRRLPAKYQTIITLRYLNGLNVAQIAERLSLSAGAVKIRLHRGRRQLAFELGQTRGETPC